MLVTQISPKRQRDSIAGLPVLLLVVALISCVSVKRNAPEPVISRFSEPEVGSVTTVNVGDIVLRQGHMVEETYLNVLEEIAAGLYTIPVGLYKRVGFDANWTFFEADGVKKSGLADPLSALAVPLDTTDRIRVVTIWGTWSTHEGVFRVETRPSPRYDALQQSLIYSGRIGNQIAIGYREFSNSLARPAFNNDVNYDLDASTTIGYKGARLEVLEATNTSLTFRLLSGFGPP